MKIFLSYTSADRAWAQWIGVTLRDAGHEIFVHEWEIGPGESIPEWMERRLGQADKMIGVFSPVYMYAIHSNSERWAAYWHDPGGRNGFLVPIEVVPLADWPIFAKNLRRLSLVGKAEEDAARELIAFFEPPAAPTIRPPFPGPRLGPTPERGGTAPRPGRHATAAPLTETTDPAATDAPFAAGGADLPAVPAFPPAEAQHVEVAPPSVIVSYAREDFEPGLIRDSEALEAWLKGKSRDVAMVVAARSALRFAPLLAGMGQKGASLSDFLLPLLYGMAAPWAAAGYPTHGAKFRDVAHTALTARAANDTAAFRSDRTAFASADAFTDADARRAAEEAVAAAVFATAALATDAAAAVAADVIAAFTGFRVDSRADAESFAGLAARHAGHAASVAARAPLALETAWAFVDVDLAALAGGLSPADLARLPLFPTLQPLLPEHFRESATNARLLDLLDRSWRDLEQRLLAEDSNWRVWTEWYDDRRHGHPADEEKELARLTLPEETLKAGATVANAEIKRRFDEIDARRAAEARPKAPEQIEGSRLELTSERGLTFPTEIGAAELDDPGVQAALHGQLKKALPRLLDAITTPNHTYDKLEDVLAEYQELVDVPADRLDVALVWGAGAALLGMADAFEVQNTDKTFTDPLEPQQLALLKQAAQLHGAFILGFPLARRLMDAAERFKLASDTIAAIDGPTAEMLRRFGEQHDWVEESARKFIASLGNAYHQTGWKVTASGYSAYVLVRNALVVVTRHLAKANSALATIAGGFLVGDIDPGLEVTRHAMRFVLEHVRTIMAFAQPFPELRAWFGWVIDHLDEQNRE